MQEIKIYPIAINKNNRKSPVDDHWFSIESAIELYEKYPASCFDGIEQFSRLEHVYYFHKSDKTIIGSEHTRENTSCPITGIFAQSNKDRPNHIETTKVQLVKREGRVLHVKNLDAIDDTPVLDIKPVFSEFLPLGEIIQPEWTKNEKLLVNLLTI